MRRSGLTAGELIDRLKAMLGRDALSRHTLRDWRSGENPVPFEAFLAVCRIAELRPPLVVVMLRERLRQTGQNAGVMGELVALWGE